MMLRNASEYGMPNVALFDICIFLIDLRHCDVYSKNRFVFNLYSLLLPICTSINSIYMHLFETENSHTWDSMAV